MRKPAWFYGILFLVLSAVPTVMLGRGEDPETQRQRMTSQIIFSVIGFGLIGVSAFNNWKNQRKP